MADKDFGVKRINLVGAAGTPTITSPTDLIINANKVAISTNATVGGNLGIGTTNPTSKLWVNGDGYFVGVITANKFSGQLDAASAQAQSVGFATTATNLAGGTTGNVPYQSNAGITTFVTNPGVSGKVLLFNGSLPIWGDVSSASGAFGGISVQDESSPVGTSGNITTLNFVGANILATATTGPNGIATITIADYVSISGYSTNSGISTFATKAGIATFTSEWILGANGSADYTFTGPGFTGAENDPILYLVRGQQYKFTNTMGMHPFRIQSTVNGSAGTQYNDGITNNDVSNGTLTWDVQFDTPGLLYYQCTAHGGMGGKIYIIDAGIGPDISINTTGIITASSFVGTALSISGISTLGTVKISSGIITATTGIVTYFGDGSQLTGVTGTQVVSQPFTSTPVYPILASNVGVSSVGISTTGPNALVFIPSSGNLGIGTTNPTSKLTVQGDVLVSGVSTLGTVKISSGIITASSGIVTYYGDGSKLTGISASQRNTNSFTATEGQTTFIVSYTPGYIDVYLNGSRLSSAEYTATNGTSIILSVGASVNDVIETVSIDSLGIIQTTTASGLTGTPNIVVGIVTATKYYGDGSSLTGVSGGGSIQILDRGVLVGTAITTINFSGVGFTAISTSSGISTIVLTGSQRTVNSFVATEGQTVFYCPYTTSAVDVYLNGSRISSVEYIAIDGTTITLSVGASLNDIVEVVSFTSVGSVVQSTAQYSAISGISSSSLGLTGTPNIVVGIVTATSINVGVVTATQYFGDGSNLTGISAGGGSGSIQIRNQGTLVGTSITAINFSGVGISTIATSSGISTIVITGSQRTVNSFTATEGQTNFSCTYAPSAVDVYLNGARLNSSEYIAIDGTTITLSVGASLNDIVEVVSFTSVGVLNELTSQYSAISGISSSSLGLTGTPNIVVGIVTASNYYGNGSNLSNVVGQVSVSNQGTFVGSGITVINFVGTGVSSIVSSSGIATVSFVGSQRNTASFVATAGQTVFTTSYTVGYVDVYKDGTRLSASQFTATDGVTIVLSSGATVGQVIDIVSATNVINNITNSNDTRLQSVSEKINITSGNTVSLVYNTGSGNIGITTNPSGDITLNVNGIPIDSSFDSRRLQFSVIVTQTGTARSCTAITLNGVSRTIRWSGGSLSGAITKGGNTANGYDVYNFIGINTVGSASTTTNYIVLGSIDGGFS